MLCVRTASFVAVTGCFVTATVGFVAGNPVFMTATVGFIAGNPAFVATRTCFIAIYQVFSANKINHFSKILMWEIYERVGNMHLMDLD